MNRFRLGLLLVILVVVAGAGWLAMNLGQGRGGRPNVVLISIDTCRADHVSCYGRFRNTTPNIDAVAAAGILFENVIAPVPMTLPSHSSMLTGTIPPYHRVHDNLNYHLADDNVTLAEQLRKHGYQTGAVIGSFVLDAQFGTAQGFQTYNDDFSETTLEVIGGQPERRGDAVTEAGLAWLEEHAADPFFLFLHYYDPHLPYDPPEPFASIFADDPYKGEIAFADQCVGQVVDKLNDLGLYDSTLLVITADHGEGRGDHGETLHGYFIYHATTKVPLIVKLPRQRQPRRVRAIASLVDLVPTILAQLGLPPPAVTQGVDLFAEAPGGTAAHGPTRFVYSESMIATKLGCGSLLGLETDRWKYIQAPEPELYDLESDPGEARNVIAEHLERAEYYRDRLRVLLQEHLRTDSEGTKVELDEQSLERLRSLGYTGGDVVEAFEFDTDKPDPKGFLGIFTKIEGVHYYLNDGNLKEARRFAEEVLAERPELAYVHEKLARIAQREGKPEEAIDHLKEAIRLEPGQPQRHNELGVLLARQGRGHEAIAQYREALRLTETGAPAAGNLDHMMVSAARDRPIVSGVHLNLGLVLLGQGNAEEAIEQFQLATRSDAENVTAYVRWGEAAAGLGRIEEAVEAYTQVLRLKPDHQAAKRAVEALRPQAKPAP
jgi:arylsulfatase A-like enzyme/Tfp pilus assembly protein PilF